MERVLLRFTKEDDIRFVGHLDLMRMLERAMRRSRFPIAYSQGFNPRPRMAFASALTLGATSEWELCQLDLASDLEERALREAVAALRPQLPEGMRILNVWPLPVQKRNGCIQVLAATYTLTCEGIEGGGAVREFLQSGAGLPQARDWAWTEQNGVLVLQLTLPVGERTGVRIRDAIATLEEGVPGLRVTRLHRARLWCEQEPEATSL